MDSIDVEKIKKTPICFIIGSPRSGTTMLRMLFDAHPNIAIPIEHPYFLLFYSKYHKIKYWTKELLIEFYEDLRSKQKFKEWSIDYWSLDSNVIKNNLLKCEGKNDFHTICKVIHLSYESFYEKKDITLIADQNPVYSVCINKLIEVFDNVKFIHITRDYRDHINSIKNVSFGGDAVPLIALRWKLFLKNTLKYKKQHPELFFTVKYEDFVLSPDKYMKEISSFLDIEYLPSVFDFYKIQSNLNDYSKLVENRDKRLSFFNFFAESILKYHSNLMKPINSSNIYAWRKSMPSQEVELADFMVGKYAELAGYERKYNRINVFLFFKTSLLYIHYFTQILIGKLLIFLPLKLRYKIASRESIVEKLYVKLTKKSHK